MNRKKSARSGSFCLTRRRGEILIFSSLLSICGDEVRNFTKLQLSLVKAKLKFLQGVSLPRVCEMQKIWDLNGFVLFLVFWKQSYNIWLWNLTKQQLENWIVRTEAALGMLASRTWKRRRKVFVWLQGQLGKISLDALRTVTWDLGPIS